MAAGKSHFCLGHDLHIHSHMGIPNCIQKVVNNSNNKGRCEIGSNTRWHLSGSWTEVVLDGYDQNNLTACKKFS